MLSTEQKIALARMCERPLVFVRRALGLGSEVRARRGGVNWQLDLEEGVDLSIYLLGAFERRLIRLYGRLVKPGSVVLDVGANIGAHTLPLARLVGAQGRVIAIEPTDWAFAKLLANVALNPDLAPRIVARQAFLMARDQDEKPKSAYSSWPLVQTAGLHPRLCGREMSVGQAMGMTLDALLSREGLDRVDFVKVDVDGHEVQVLRGASRLLREMRPLVLLEMAPYLMVEHGDSVDALLGLMHDAGYSVFPAGGGEPLDLASVLRLADRSGAENFLARPTGPALRA